ncbi:uncharacterized protein PSFLO_06938 [Pseudozyma flocculosa]|uniref:Uncharacterized protein n=1 Tax=Pseudozyma flocculosa TaxID=84751 RepID=A0A5C3FBF4_9BASI|nr:uncharacterized protein PSFLO_06938 [Pseudozyma flocculosa]
MKSTRIQSRIGPSITEVTVQRWRQQEHASPPRNGEKSRSKAGRRGGGQKHDERLAAMSLAHSLVLGRRPVSGRDDSGSNSAEAGRAFGLCTTARDAAGGGVAWLMSAMFGDDSVVAVLVVFKMIGRRRSLVGEVSSCVGHGDFPGLVLGGGDGGAWGSRGVRTAMRDAGGLRSQEVEGRGRRGRLEPRVMGRAKP